MGASLSWAFAAKVGYAIDATRLGFPIETRLWHMGPAESWGRWFFGREQAG